MGKLLAVNDKACVSFLIITSTNYWSLPQALALLRGSTSHKGHLLILQFAWKNQCKWNVSECLKCVHAHVHPQKWQYPIDFNFPLVLKVSLNFAVAVILRWQRWFTAIVLKTWGKVQWHRPGLFYTRQGTMTLASLGHAEKLFSLIKAYLKFQT